MAQLVDGRDEGVAASMYNVPLSRRGESISGSNLRLRTSVKPA